MLTDLVKTLKEAVDAEGLMSLVESVWEIDRYFTYPKFHEAAAFEVEKMRSWGLEAEVLEAPADGETVVGEWRVPLAWDCASARAEIAGPSELAGQVIADTGKCPTHKVMWSGPTPPDGITAPLEYVAEAGKEESYTGRNLKGKIILIDNDARNSKMLAVRHGAAAIISCYNPHPEELPDAVFWTNGWSDDPGGWAYHKGDTPLPAISISPAEGKRLAGLLQEGKEIEIRLQVDSRYYEGTLPLASFLLRGREAREEVLILGHGFEQGANDNATGVAAIMESLRALNALMEAGRLPRPKRSIRGLVTNECYGTYAFAEMRPDVIKRTIAAINVDSIGQKQQKCRAVAQVHLNPHANIHYSDTLFVHMLETVVKKEHPYFAYTVDGFSLDDNGIADPAYGVPTVLLDTPELHWHTTADTMENVDAGILKTLTVACAAMLYGIADAGEEFARHAAALVAGRHMHSAAVQIAAGVDRLYRVEERERSSVLSSLRNTLAYNADRAEDELLSTRELVSDSRLVDYGEWLAELRGLIRETARVQGEHLSRQAHLLSLEEGRPLDDSPTQPIAEELVRAEGLVPVRKFRGTPSFDTLPKEARAALPSPRWNSLYAAACFWANGKRRLSEVAMLAAMEMNARPERVVKFFELLAEHGLVEMKAAGESINL
ncbi:MAG: M28 family peptidase [Planctomycetes bacterium]|nr:M28 family peptidase [Planctomycetota bacterium]